MENLKYLDNSNVGTTIQAIKTTMKVFFPSEVYHIGTLEQLYDVSYTTHKHLSTWNINIQETFGSFL